MYLVFTCMPGECYCRDLGLCRCIVQLYYVFVHRQFPSVRVCFFGVFFRQIYDFFNAQSTMIVTFGQIRLLSAVNPLLLIYTCIDWCLQCKVISC